MHSHPFPRKRAHPASPLTNQWRILSLAVTVCPFMQFGPLLLRRVVWSPAFRRFSFFLPTLTLLALLITVQAQTNQVITNLTVPEVLASNVTRIALLEHYALTESSGLAASPKYRNVFWSHNDSESPTFLFALDVQGKHIGGYEVQDANLIDWEAIAFDESGRLYLADTGSDGMVRSHSAVHRVAEPDISKGWGPARVERTWYIRFPGPREDCEAMFIHQGFAYLISKLATTNIVAANRFVNYYRFNLAGDDEFVLAEHLGTLQVSDNVSDASLSSDKQRLALLTSDGVEILFINGNPLNATNAPRRSTRYEHPLMEGAAFVGTSVLVTTEKSTNTPAGEMILFNDPDLSGAPRIVTGLTNRTAFVGGSVTFEVEVEGVPPLAFEWRLDGRVIPGATNTTLVLTNLALANAGTYEVTVSNIAGVASSSAELTVNERIVDLRITEIMSSESTNRTFRHEDWWELTSFSTETNDLSGWRFNDSTGDLTDAFVIPQGTLIAPGESIVFVEDLSPGQFRDWWGEANISTNVQIVTYDTNEISFNAVRDQLRVWNATNPEPYLQVDIGRATTGVTFTRDPVSGQMVNSVLGVNGAFAAIDGGDIGSPGLYVTDSISGVRLEGALRGPALQISFPVEPTKTYTIEQSDTLFPGAWRPVIEGVQGPGTGDILFQRSLAVTNRFFRLRVEER